MTAKKDKKFLSDIIRIRDIKVEGNTLMISPTGSGKTYYIFNKLCKDKTCLYLCDTTNLKNQVLKEDGTREYLDMDIESNVTVMTYSKFGSVIKYSNEAFINNFEIVVCDEVHNLIDYHNFSEDPNLDRAIEYLIRKYDNTQIVFFTGTPQYLNYLSYKYPAVGNNFNVINLYDDEEIMRYTENMVAYLAHYTDVKTYLTRYKRGFDTNNLKCLIFSPYVKNMLELERICADIGLRPTCIWSEHNKMPMTQEQVRVKNHLLDTGMLLEPYNVLIINRATETGVNIIDKDMNLMICNTVNEVQQEQARGRIRHDIDLLVLKTDDLKQVEFNIDKEILGLWLTKESVVERVIIKNNMRDKNGKLIGMPTLMDRIQTYGYTLESKRRGKKRTTQYIINKIEDK